jgi:hypothetical protein
MSDTEVARRMQQAKRDVRADKKIGKSQETQWKWTVKLTVYRKPGKRSCRFPPFLQTLEIERADS